MDVRKEVKYSGVLAASLFLISLYICGYLLTYESTKFHSELIDNNGNKIDDYSISFSLANGNHIAMTVLFTLGLFAFYYMLHLKFPIKQFNFYLISILIFIIYSLVVSMIFYSPYENKAINFNTKISEEHGIVAITAFTSNVILNMFVAYHIFYKRGSYNLYFWALIIMQLGFYLSLVADAEYSNYIKTREPNNTYKDVYFPIAENINFLFFVLTMFLLAFLPFIKKKTKPVKKLSENNIKMNYIKLANE
jgi:hypothetical protein